MRKIFLFLLLFLLLIFSVIGWTPQNDIQLRNEYAIWNATTITGSEIYEAGNRVLTNASAVGVNQSYIDSQDQAVNASARDYADTQDVIYNESMKDYTDNTFITLANEGSLNVNHSNTTTLADSATFWASVSGFATRWFADIGNIFTFNETLLNNSIADIVTTTNTSQNAYIDAQDIYYNNSLAVDSIFKYFNRRVNDFVYASMSFTGSEAFIDMGGNNIQSVGNFTAESINGTEITRGIVADARIANTITRDSEILNKPDNGSDAIFDNLFVTTYHNITTKMNWSSPVDADIIPDTNYTRDLGSNAIKFQQINTNWINLQTSLKPDNAGIIALPSTDGIYFPGNGTIGVHGKLYVDNNITGNYYIGDGSLLTGIINQTYIDTQDSAVNASARAYTISVVTSNNESFLIYLWDNYYNTTQILANNNSIIDFVNAQISSNNLTLDGTFVTHAELISANTSMKDYADNTFILLSSEGNLNVNHSDSTTLAEDSTAWITMAGLQSKWLADVGNILTFDETELNTTIGSFVTTTYYNMTSSAVVIGTPQGTATNINAYDGVAYNITDASADIDYRLNFSGVEEINQIVVRYNTDDPVHTVIIYLWDYDDSEWESYDVLGDSEGEFIIKTMPVFDSSEHTDGNLVQMRIYGLGTGGNHKWQFDWITISKGLATPSSTEVDPLSIHKTGDVALTADWNAGNFDIIADSFNGSWNGSGLYDTTTIIDSKIASIGNWTNDKGDYYTSAETDTEIANNNATLDATYLKESEFQGEFDSSWNLTNNNQLANGAGYITDYIETDPSWSANESLVFFNADWNLTQLSELNNDLGFITDYTETDPLWTANSTLVFYQSDWNLTQISELNNDAGYVTTDTTYDNESPIGLTGTTFSFIPCGNSEGYTYNTSSNNWECQPIGSGSGSVTSVATDDTYLTGGPITGSGTITFDTTLAGTSLAVDSADKWDSLDTPTDIGSDDITDDGTWIVVGEEGNLNVNHSDTSSTANTWDGETSQANLDVNSADLWDALNTPADINAGDITDDGTYLTSYTETDPLWAANSTLVFYESDWNLTQVSELNNDEGFITSYTETDPRWQANSTLVFYESDWNLTQLSELNNDEGFITSYTETDPRWQGNYSAATGTGTVVLSNTPSLITPDIGAATGDSLSLDDGGTIDSGTCVQTFDDTGDDIEFSGCNVGIGTSSPGELLEVRGNTKNIEISNDGESEAGIIFTDAQAPTSQYGKILYSSAGAGLKFFVHSGTPSMTLDTGGKVGIGTTSPDAKLDIYNKVQTPLHSGGDFSNLISHPYVWSDNYSNANIVNLDLYTEIGGLTGAGNFSGTNLTGIKNIMRTSWTAGPRPDFIAYYAQASTGTHQHMNDYYGLYLDTEEGAGLILGDNYGVYQADDEAENYFAGNVGIGTSSPGELLEVRGNTKNIEISNNDESEAGIIFTDAQAPTSQYGKILFDSSNNGIKFYVNSATPAITLENGGNVGIGTTSPAEQLEIKAPDGVDATFRMVSDNGDLSSKRWTLRAEADADRFYFNNDYGGDVFSINSGGTLEVGEFPAVGSDPMCWDGAEPSEIGDCSSSIEYKKEVTDLKIDITDYKNLQPREFVWKHNNVTDIGLIAEEVNETAPYLARYRDGEPKSVKYDGLAVANLKMIQYLMDELCSKDDSYGFCKPPKNKDKDLYDYSNLRRLKEAEYTQEFVKVEEDYEVTYQKERKAVNNELVINTIEIDRKKIVVEDVSKCPDKKEEGMTYWYQEKDEWIQCPDTEVMSYGY